jgi:hypothetical protein
MSSFIESFLANRTQDVIFHNEKSTYIPVEFGLPQGLVLHPSLFLYYINDIPVGLSSTIRQFAAVVRVVVIDYTVTIFF